MSRGFIFWGSLTQSLKYYFYHSTFCAGLFPMLPLFLRAFYDDNENYSGLKISCSRLLPKLGNEEGFNRFKEKGLDLKFARLLQ